MGNDLGHVEISIYVDGLQSHSQCGYNNSTVHVELLLDSAMLARRSLTRQPSLR